MAAPIELDLLSGEAPGVPQCVVSERITEVCKFEASGKDENSFED